MIKNKSDLKSYIEADRIRNQCKSNCLLRFIGLGGESQQVLCYLKILRYLEYYENVKQRNFFLWILYKIEMLFYLYMTKKIQIYIKPNTVGKGLYIPHYAGGIIINCLNMGDYCTVSSGVIVGNKGSDEYKPIIGNNVELTVGCKIIGLIKIGDNVIVAPNSVVINDVKSNSVVSGVPAKIIRMI